MGRSTAAAFAVPATGSTQCQVWPATTASKVRPAGLQVSNGRDLDLDPAAARRLGHPLVDVNTEHTAAGGLELASDDAGSHADVEDLPARELVDQLADERGGVARPGAVVALRVGAERLRPLAVSVRLLLGEAGRRWVGWGSGHSSNVGVRDPHTSAATVSA